MEERNENMTVKIVAITKPLVEGIETADEFLAYCARVSNPSNQMNVLTAPKLLSYCLKNKHWSVFETVSVTCSIETTRDIAHQILRHRSFSFQEFSQRYADPTKDMGFTISEARFQDTKNRQSSIEVDDEDLQKSWVAKQQQIAHESQLAYKWAIDNNIAKELARKVLPEGLTNTRLYMAGTLRSWITYVDVREPEGTQKEHRIIAKDVKALLLEHFPSLNDYWKTYTTTGITWEDIFKRNK